MGGVARNSGHLCHRLEWQHPSFESDELGGRTVSFVTVERVWARVTPVASTLTNQAEHLESETRYRVLIRHRDGVKPGQRFLFRGRKLIIQSIVDENEQTRFLLCACRQEGAS